MPTGYDHRCPPDGSPVGQGWGACGDKSFASSERPLRGRDGCGRMSHPGTKPAAEVSAHYAPGSSAAAVDLGSARPVSPGNSEELLATPEGSGRPHPRTGRLARIRTSSAWENRCS